MPSSMDEGFCSFCFGLTLFDNLPANLGDRFIRQQFLAIADVIPMIGFVKKPEQNSYLKANRHTCPPTLVRFGDATQWRTVSRGVMLMQCCDGPAL